MDRPVVQPRWQEWITLILGAWVFVSPWIFGFTASQAVTLNYFIVGAVMFVCSGAAIVRNESAEWVSLIAAVWLAVSPWILGYMTTQAPKGDAILVGVLGIIFAAWGLAQPERRMTRSHQFDEHRITH
jgi:SPW repeat